jgi:acetyltransferase-like isoleucine patch superfamily enzyme
VRAKRLLRALLLFVLPSPLARMAGNALGYRIAPTARIGLSWIDADALTMAEGAYIGHFNQFRGPFAVEMAANAKIGHFNTLSRASMIVSVGPSTLTLGIWSAVTARHRLDLTTSIHIGDYSTIAGTGCQLWTHGYVHETEGLGRYRIDGAIHIADNVYIGSMCFISMGVRIAKGVIVGGGSSVAKNLLEPGLYVSSALRMLPRPGDPDQRPDLERLDASLSCDQVYRKRDGV